MKKIPLAGGLHILVDDKDYEKVRSLRWFASSRKRKHIYAVAVVPYGQSTRKLGLRRPLKKIQMHRFLMNPPDDLTVDYINGNGLDNQRCNLRIANNQQQKANCFPVKGKRFKGVARYVRGGQDSGKWRAQIEVNGKNRHIGYFESEEAAAVAYNLEATKAFGEYAKLNKVEL